MAKIAESRRGTRHSTSHCDAISRGQKRRHALRRVLAAVEQTHRDLTASSEPGDRPVMLSMLMGSAKSGKSANVEDLQSEYSVQLREFRRCGLLGPKVGSERALACTEKARR